MNEACPLNGCERVRTLEHKVERMEKTVASHDVTFAQINTKLNGILWACGVIATALIGVLVKMIF